MDQKFIKGLDLSEILYRDAVKPILDEHFPDLVYSAALLGPGSDVLGLDTEQSRDHDWGPRLMLFLGQADYQSQHEALDRVLRRELPAEIRGYPTNFGLHEDGTFVMVAGQRGSINHKVSFHTARRYFTELLHFDPTNEIGIVDWISLPENRLLMATSGRVFDDRLGQLDEIRERLRYYPDDIWLYLMAAQWRRISQEEALMGRCGQVGDDLGSALIAARLVRDLMRLCFLIERRYAPYNKWLGSAFAQLGCAAQLLPVLEDILTAQTWQARQVHLTEAYQIVAKMHNALGVTAPVPTRVSKFYSRPFQVIHAGRFVAALRAGIQNVEVAALPEHLGSFDQFVDSTDAQHHLGRFKEIWINKGSAGPV